MITAVQLTNTNYDAWTKVGHSSLQRVLLEVSPRDLRCTPARSRGSNNSSSSCRSSKRTMRKTTIIEVAALSDYEPPESSSGVPGFPSCPAE